MQQTPKSLRLHIALLGRVNAGKSSFLNLITGQDVSITSNIAGTTTDVVEKAQELLPIGPVVWLDTAGFGDETDLATERLAKTKRVLDRADVVVLVCEGDKIGKEEEEIIKEAKERKLPLIKVYNKSDLYACPNDGIKVTSTDKNSRDRVLTELKSELIKVVPEDFIKTPPVLGDLVVPHSTVVMLIPIDYEAPKGRLIMPQVQAIRDALDHDLTVVVVKETDYAAALENMKTPPSLVVCDSQVVDKMVQETPKNIKCTTFSTLFARLKGDIVKLVLALLIGFLHHADFRLGKTVILLVLLLHLLVELVEVTLRIGDWLQIKLPFRTGKIGIGKLLHRSGQRWQCLLCKVVHDFRHALHSGDVTADERHFRSHVP